MTQILIAGDSFSSDQLAGENGWPRALAKKYSVTNVSQPGIGEYKILQNLKSQKLSNFDVVIVSHTSPNRVHCEINPLYPAGHLYSKSDIIFADAESKHNESIIDYFKLIFDTEYYRFVHTSCCREIDQITNTIPVIHMTNFEWSGLYEFDSMLNFYSLWTENRGNEVHYNKNGNDIILAALIDQIKMLKNR
jgi:hypothetical protein